MTRNLGMMAGLLVLAACGEKGGTDAVTPSMAASSQGTSTPSKLLGAGPSETPKGDCSGKRIDDPLILTLDKRSLKQLGGNDQQIARNVSRGGDILEDPPEITGGVLYPTNLDLQADSNGKTMKGNNYVEIRIRLDSADMKKRDMIFLRTTAGTDPDVDRDPAAAVTVRAGDEEKFCFDGEIKRNGSIETVTLLSKLKPDEQSSINIGVQVRNKKKTKFSTPIYIDPNVRNVG